MRPLLLAFDAGTGSGRAAVFDVEGELVASARRRWRARAPEELAPFGQELDAEAIWSALLDAADEALASVNRARVIAVAATGQRIACAFVDEDRTTLYLGPNRDIRALAGADLRGLDEDALYRSSGRFPPWIFAPGRALWFATREPALHARIRYVLGLPDWVAHRLSGELATDASTAADLMLLDVAQRAPDPRAIEASRLPADSLPPLAEPGARLGTIRGEVAARLGLPATTIVAVGGADTQLALLGAGVIDGGSALVAGSSAPLVRVTDAPLFDPKGRLWTNPHVERDRWLLEANVGEMGTRHAWMLETLGADLLREPDPYAAYDALAETAPIGSLAASAHLGPRAMDLRALNTGRPAALLLPFGETTAVGPGRAELMRAYLESCAFAVRAAGAWIDDVAGPREGPLTLAGGMARSPLFCLILASVLRCEIVRGPAEASARGAAACAAVAAGIARDLGELAWRRDDDRCEPDEDDAASYDDAFERWVEREEQLESF